MSVHLSLLLQMKTVSDSIYDKVRACASIFGRAYAKRRNDYC